LELVEKSEKVKVVRRETREKKITPSFCLKKKIFLLLLLLLSPLACRLFSFLLF